jgi:hypothetical protein
MSTREIAETLRSAASSPFSEEALQAVIRLAMRTGDWTAGSITSLTPTGSMRIVAHIDDRAIACDRIEVGRGPAYDAVHDGSVQFSGDLREDGRWGTWPTSAFAMGIVSTLSVRLYTADTLGALNLYSGQEQGAERDVFDCLEVFGAHASMVLAHFTADQQLQKAIHVGNLVGQAQGILIQRYQLTADSALALLRAVSEQNNDDIVELAMNLIATGELN